MKTAGQNAYFIFIAIMAATPVPKHKLVKDEYYLNKMA